jgi:hypothetical protein
MALLPELLKILRAGAAKSSGQGIRSRLFGFEEEFPFQEDFAREKRG